jgi:hypothetical protein
MTAVCVEGGGGNQNHETGGSRRVRGTRVEGLGLLSGRWLIGV